MALSFGTRIGPYEIVDAIGAGGMGEVYRATDTKLGREVAIKTLPSTLAADTDRLARFEREAKLLATLNHPNIAIIYGLEEAEGTQCIAMELIEGETLEEKLKDGPCRLRMPLRLALQIAQALEAAHEKGVSPSRLETCERDGHRRWPGESTRFRSCQGVFGRSGPGERRTFPGAESCDDPTGHGARYSQLHESRTGQWSGDGSAC